MHPSPPENCSGRNKKEEKFRKERFIKQLPYVVSTLLCWVKEGK